MPASSKTKRYIEIILIIVIILILSMLLLPNIKSSHLAGRRDKIRYQMRMIGRAFQGYYHQHGCMPPAVLTDTNGIPIHSWRALVLPYLELYKNPIDYHFEDPWNSNHNQDMANQYQDLCSRFLGYDNHHNRKTTKLVAVVDDSTLWSPFRTCPNQRIVNNNEKYIVVIEIPNPGGLWNEPSDISLDDLIKMIKNSTFSEQGTHVLFNDGEVRWLSPEEITAQNMLKLLIVNQQQNLVDL